MKSLNEIEKEIVLMPDQEFFVSELRQEAIKHVKKSAQEIEAIRTHHLPNYEEKYHDAIQRELGKMTWIISFFNLDIKFRFMKDGRTLLRGRDSKCLKQ